MRDEAALSLLALPTIMAHGNVVYPPSWFDAGGAVGLSSGAGCAAVWDGKGATTRCSDQGEAGVECTSCMWFSNYTMLPEGVEATIPTTSPLRTYLDFNFRKVVPARRISGSSLPNYCTTDADCVVKTSPTGIFLPADIKCNLDLFVCEPADRPVDIWGRYPWRAPGRAPVWSSCGVAGGNPRGCFHSDGTRTSGRAGGCAEGGFDGGPDARYVSFPDVVTTAWRAGSVVEAAWAIRANHGGGYAYRLCPSSTAEHPLGLPLTEECFQAHPLPFHGEVQWLQFGANRSTRDLFGPIPAVDVSDGTWPPRSAWRRNPIPACQGAGSVSPAGRGGANQTAYPNRGGAAPCSPASFVGSAYEGVASGPQAWWPRNCHVTACEGVALRL